MTLSSLAQLWSRVPLAQQQRLIAQRSQMVTRHLETLYGKRRSPPMSPTTPVNALASPKIQRAHHERLAMVYVRQSRPQQLIRHPESTRVQYGLVDRALALGWPQAQVVVIDEDLGKSAASASERSGFQRLVAEVSLAHVGIILGLEMSRLAR